MGETDQKIRVQRRIGVREASNLETGIVTTTKLKGNSHDKN